MARPMKPEQKVPGAKHHFDHPVWGIVLVVFVGSVLMFANWEPTANVVAQDSYSCAGAEPDSYCDYGYKNRCEVGCSDCGCMSYCDDVCAAQGKFVKYCSEASCVCTEENACA